MSQPKVCPQCNTRYEEQHLFCTLDGAALVTVAPRSDLVGTVIADRYLVISKLGDGGMGQVYLAEHVRMKRKCAVKVMRPGLMSDPDAISRFNREAENASRVIHQNVATVYDFGETSDGLIYLAMEYIEGDSLGRILEREKAIHPIRAAEIIRQAAEALDVAHSHGILHRDLKPENIMISRTREHLDHVKIVDFGIARAMSSDTQRVTRTGSMVGTPEFMSPEQFAGDALDSRTDLYSLALVAFNMLTGASAYPTGTSKDNLIVRLTQPPRRLHDVKDLPWPEDLQRTFDKALANDPARRHETVLEFSREMTAAIASMPASQTGEIYLSALASALAARNTSTPGRSVTPVEVKQESPEPEALPEAVVAPRSRSRGRPSAMLAIAAVLVLAVVGAMVGRSMIGPDSTTLAIVPDSLGLDSAAASGALDSANAADATTHTAAATETFNNNRGGVLTLVSSAGSGLAFLADASGLIVAPTHLIPRDSAVTVQVDDTTRLRARVVLSDSTRPVSVLAIARNRCPRCPALTLASGDSVPAVVAGDSVIAIGGARPARQRILRGSVTVADANSLRTSVRADAAESGAPILTMGGAVLGMTRVRAGAAPSSGYRDAALSELRTALAGAQKVISSGRVPPPSDTLLPVRPAAPFPADPIKTVAAVENLDLLKKYVVSEGSFDVFVMTPPTMAWRDARAKAALAKLKSTPAGAASRLERMDPIQAWRGWDGCIRSRCAVVVINVVPDRTPFLFHKPTEVVDFSRGNVQSVRLMRDGVLVEPIESDYIPASLNGVGHETARKPMFAQGVVMYRAREFAPKPTGGIARYELMVVDATRPDRPVRIAIPAVMIQNVINDFAPYGLTR